VKKVRSGVTTIYLEGLWEEVIGGDTKRYYTLNGRTVAVRNFDGTTQTVSMLNTDHQGSVKLIGAAGGGSQEFDPWGKRRSGAVPETRRNFTGQYLDDTGLLFYNARYYDPAIGRFRSADTIVPGSTALTTWPSDSAARSAWQGEGSSGPSNPQDLNRYSYVNNNPVTNVDPTGHWRESAIDIGFIAYDLYDIQQNGLNWTNGLALAADIVSLALPVVAGGGMAVRAAAHVYDVAAAVTAANKADTAVDATGAATTKVDAVGAFCSFATDTPGRRGDCETGDRRPRARRRETNKNSACSTVKNARPLRLCGSKKQRCAQSSEF
jgi:RHS repeat-associated protein